jgi:hypothetical protein
MTDPRRSTLHVAIVAALGLVSPAHAVHVNPRHLGSVLIFPYYTVRADGGGPGTHYYDNYLSIVNTTASTKAVKVRFLEGKRAATVLSFNLFLSPFDVWTGGVVRTTNLEGQEAAKLVSTDQSCTVPNILFQALPGNLLNQFSNANYATSNDGGGATLDRTREGYLEVLEMGEVTNPIAIAAAKHPQSPTPGAPGNCAYFEANEATFGAQMTPPTGGLYGGLSLINVLSGSDFTYDAMALDQWSPAAVQYTPANSTEPSLAPAGASTVSTILTSDGAVTSTWASARDAVSAAMMQYQVINEWVLETATQSGTDWVVTFPTKKLYSSVGDGVGIPPFNANFNNGHACDHFTTTFYNREEFIPPVRAVILPGVPPNLPPSNVLCYTANVITFANSYMLGSNNSYNLDTTDAGRTGHMILGFDQAIQVLTPLATTINGTAVSPRRYYGLPVVGFMIQDFANGNVGTPPVLSNYGGNFAHKYRSQVAP